MYENYSSPTTSHDLFEDFTTLRWVKWAKRKPHFNGSVIMRYNGENIGTGTVHKGVLLKHDVLSKEDFERYENSLYWLEEIIDKEGFMEQRKLSYE